MQFRLAVSRILYLHCNDCSRTELLLESNTFNNRQLVAAAVVPCEHGFIVLADVEQNDQTTVQAPWAELCFAPHQRMYEIFIWKLCYLDSVVLKVKHPLFIGK